jgi:hypothetical protein
MHDLCTAEGLRAAVLELIHDRWQQAKIEQSQHEDDEAHYWAEAAHAKAEALMELADAVRRIR